MRRFFVAYSWFYLPVAIFLLIALVLALTIPYGQEILFFNDLRQEPLNSFFRFVSWWGESWLWFVPGLICLIWRPQVALLIAIAGLIIIPISYVVKDQVGTDRPITYFSNYGMETSVVTVPEVRLNRGQTSFPSGHTMSAFGLYSLIVLILGPTWRKTAFGLAILAIMVGISRIFLVQHFLVDVLGGALLGLTISGVVFYWQTRRAGG